MVNNKFPYTPKNCLEHVVPVDEREGVEYYDDYHYIDGCIWCGAIFEVTLKIKALEPK